VCDIACALADCVSVGLHTTYSTKSAYAAMKTTDISLLLCSSDIVYSKSSTVDSSSEGTGGKGAGLKRGGSAGYSGSHSFWTVEDVLQLHRSTPQETVNASVANGHSEGRLPQHVVVMDSSETSFSLSHPREGQGQRQIFEISGSQAAGEGMCDTFNPRISYLVDAVRAATNTHTHTHSNSSGEHDDSESRGDSADEEHRADSYPVPTTSPSLLPREAPLELSELLEGRGSIFTLLFTSGSTGEPKAVVRTDCNCHCDCSVVECVDFMMVMCMRLMS
jgi:acyl-CoA synthetase (AMP-forming)/AMP-acid ligase II